MSTAEGPASAAEGGDQTAPIASTAPAAPSQARIALLQAELLANLASGAATTFLIGGLAAVALSLFPLRLADSQWQLGALSNLVANGSWILIGLVLLHLASMLEPRNSALIQRLLLWRRLAALAAAGYLLIVPLQVAITWIGVDASRNARERVINKSRAELKAYRDALMGAADLTDLTTRFGAIPGAPPIPEQASMAPFEDMREQLLEQLDQADARFRQQVQSLRLGPNTLLELGRQTVRGAVASLMLALGFASGAEGLFGQVSLLESLKLLARKARRVRSKPTKEGWLKGFFRQRARKARSKPAKRRRPKRSPRQRNRAPR